MVRRLEGLCFDVLTTVPPNERGTSILERAHRRLRRATQESGLAKSSLDTRRGLCHADGSIPWVGAAIHSHRRTAQNVHSDIAAGGLLWGGLEAEGLYNGVKNPQGLLHVLLPNYDGAAVIRGLGQPDSDTPQPYRVTAGKKERRDERNGYESAHVGERRWSAVRDH